MGRDQAVQRACSGGFEFIISFMSASSHYTSFGSTQWTLMEFRDGVSPAGHNRLVLRVGGGGARISADWGGVTNRITSNVISWASAPQNLLVGVYPHAGQIRIDYADSGNGVGATGESHVFPADELWAGRNYDGSGQVLSSIIIDAVAYPSGTNF
jgi:hypothetical protein